MLKIFHITSPNGGLDPHVAQGYLKCPRIVYTDLNGLFCKMVLQPQTPANVSYARGQRAHALGLTQNEPKWVSGRP
jgi:hypothetical protein